jgi:hypothetical protein
MLAGVYTRLPMLRGWSQALVHQGLFFPLLKLSLSLFQDLTCSEAQKAAKSCTPSSHAQGKQTIRSLMLPSWFMSPMSEGHPLFPVLQYCLSVGLTWTAVITNNPSCIEPGNSLFPQSSASPSSFLSSPG